ncbi:MAG: hypothetical protein IKR96_04785 [Bacteroidales bacterium]|nr:hypothetical protein [Bacteroidales bacterium]
MNIRKLFLLVACLAVTLLSSSCASSFRKKVHIQSYGVKYVVPTSARTADVMLQVGVENETVGFSVTDIHGVIKMDQDSIATFTAQDVALKGKSTEVYDVPVQAELCEGVSIIRILLMVGAGETEGLSADVDARVAKAGISKRFSVRDKKINKNQ